MLAIQGDQFILSPDGSLTLTVQTDPEALLQGLFLFVCSFTHPKAFSLRLTPL